MQVFAGVICPPTYVGHMITIVDGSQYNNSVAVVR